DRVEPRYVRDPDADTPLTRGAEPVLRSLREQLDGQPVSILLTDAAGLVLARLTADAGLERHLDRVQLSPGFSYAERYVGTNGIGTALEGGRPMHVFGHEHYAEHLEDLACAAVPIAHPVSGKTVGVMNLTCWRRDAGSLLLTLAKSTAAQIRQGLLAETGTRELALFQEYLRACRRSPGIVLALDTDVAMVNDRARAVLDPADQAALLRHGAEALATGRAIRREVPLSTGGSARMTLRPLAGGGGVLRVELLAGDPAGAPAGPPGRAGPPGLPGLAGASPLWLRPCEEVAAAYRAGEWLAVEGEPGVGKLAVLLAAARRQAPAGRVAVLDAAEAGSAGWLAELRGELARGAGAVVLRHADALAGGRLRAVAAALRAVAARPDRPWVAATSGGPLPAALAPLLPRTVRIPPLRHHPEDLRRLVPLLLGRLGSGGRLTCSPEALQLLMRSSWPGNVAQLVEVLRRAAQQRRSGVVGPADLPPESHAVSRRLLSRLESIERDAIVQSLAEAGGSKAAAARALGMSRATIYRRIHDYGIVG
ncbi:MAG TPA: GAF domain-containing protein, partial [Mycobacteriales bacterium]|nr:GAF domain-containing protein [Mycobacteriales bacterium]